MTDKLRDPWADVRTYIRRFVAEPLWWFEGEEHKLISFLNDADALLELKEYAGHTQECEMLTQGVRGICHCGFTKALAALPEHLKEKA